MSPIAKHAVPQKPVPLDVVDQPPACNINLSALAVCEWRTPWKGCYTSLF